MSNQQELNVAVNEAVCELLIYGYTQVDTDVATAIVMGHIQPHLEYWVCSKCKGSFTKEARDGRGVGPTPEGWVCVGCMTYEMDTAWAREKFKEYRAMMPQWSKTPPTTYGWYFLASSEKDWDICRPVRVHKYTFGDGRFHCVMHDADGSIDVTDPKLSDYIWFGPIVIPKYRSIVQEPTQ